MLQHKDDCEAIVAEKVLIRILHLNLVDSDISKPRQCCNAGGEIPSHRQQDKVQTIPGYK